LHLSYGIHGMVIASLMVETLMIFCRLYLSRNLVKFNFLTGVRIRKRLLKQGMTFTLLGFVSMLAVKIDLLMISFLANPLEVGIYAVAYKLTGQLKMLRNTIAMSFLPMAVKKFDVESMQGSVLIKFSSYFAIFMLILAVLINFIIEDIIVTIFGSEFQESGKIFSVLIFYQVFAWAVLPFTTVLQATHNEAIALYVNCFCALVNLTLNFLFYNRFGLIGIAYSTIVVYAAGLILMSFWTYIRMKNQGHLT